MWVSGTRTGKWSRIDDDTALGRKWREPWGHVCGKFAENPPQARARGATSNRAKWGDIQRKIEKLSLFTFHVNWRHNACQFSPTGNQALWQAWLPANRFPTG